MEFHDYGPSTPDMNEDSDNGSSGDYNNSASIVRDYEIINSTTTTDIDIMTKTKKMENLDITEKGKSLNTQIQKSGGCKNSEPSSSHFNHNDKDQRKCPGVSSAKPNTISNTTPSDQYKDSSRSSQDSPSTSSGTAGGGDVPRIIKVHRIVICSQCSWFDRALSSGMKESIDRYHLTFSLKWNFSRELTVQKFLSGVCCPA